MADLARQTLDPRSVPAGRLGGWTFTIVLLLIVGGSLLGVLIGTRAPRVSWLATGALALLLFGTLAFASQVGPAIRYRTTWLRVDDDGLEYEHGWLWRHRVSVPRARIQHTDVTQGPYARRFRLDPHRGAALRDGDGATRRAPEPHGRARGPRRPWRRRWRLSPPRRRRSRPTPDGRGSTRRR
jgi:membrane protein YdbS with pleckstrin-like domain